MLPSLIIDFNRRCPMPVRRLLSMLWRYYVKWNAKIAKWKAVMKLRPIRVDACIFGGYSALSAAGFARWFGDIRRASRPISE
jgi:hypothetical protein